MNHELYYGDADRGTIDISRPPSEGSTVTQTDTSHVYRSAWIIEHQAETREWCPLFLTPVYLSKAQAQLDLSGDSDIARLREVYPGELRVAEYVRKEKRCD